MLVCGADPRFCAINPASVTTSRARMRATGSARRHALRSLIGILVSFATPHPIGAWEKPNPVSRNVQTKWSALRVRTIIAAAKRALFLSILVMNGQKLVGDSSRSPGGSDHNSPDGVLEVVQGCESCLPRVSAHS